MKQLLFLIGFALSFSVVAEDGGWKALYDFHSKMALRGNVDAEYNLGEMSEEGRGTPKNLQTAREWYLKAAKQGHGGAEYKLGTFYEYGIGVTADRKEAMHWYEKAVSHGNYLAKRRLKEWGQKREQKMALPRPTEEKIKARKAEQEKRLIEQKPMRETAAQANKRAEEDKVRQAVSARKNADEQRARQTAVTSEKTVQQAEQDRTAAVQTDDSQATVIEGDEKEAFETDPCKTPAARFMSTCKNK